MIDALICGHLYGKPQVRTSKAGRPFVTCKIRAAMRESETVFVSVVCFSQGVVRALEEMDDGDAIAMSGELKLTAFIDKAGMPRPGVDLVGNTLTTEYHVSRKRTAMRTPAPIAAPAAAAGSSPAPCASVTEEGFDDAIPF